MTETDEMSVVDRWHGQAVIVIGEAIEDRFIRSKKTGESREEAGTPTAKPTERTSCLGGAGNTAANIASLGGRPVLISMHGNMLGERDQHHTATIINLLGQYGIDGNGLIPDQNRQTSVKTRYLVDGKLVLTTDDDTRTPVNAMVTKAALSRLERLVDHGVVTRTLTVSDYGRGLVTPELMSGARAWCSQRNGYGAVKLLIDPRPQKDQDWRTLYSGAYLVKPNLGDAGAMLERTIDGAQNREVERAARDLVRELHCAILITRGPYGMTLVDVDGVVLHLPSFANESEVRCVSGCGDTVMAALALTLSVDGYELADAVMIANAAAAVAIRDEGTAAVRASGLKAELAKRELGRGTSNVVSLSAV